MSSNYYGYGDYSDFGPVQTSTELVGIAQAILIGIIIIALLAAILMTVSMWKTFKKVGKPGWASLIPIYNTYVMCEIGGKEWWFIFLTFIPVINILATFMIYDGIAKKFGKSTAFSLGMFFVPIIFFPLLAFGKNYYEEGNQVSNSSNYNSDVANVTPSSDSDLIMEDASNISSGVSSNESLQVNNQNESFDSFDNNFNLVNEQTNQVVGQVSSNMETQNEASNFVAPQISSEMVNQNQDNTVMQNSVNEPVIETPNVFTNQRPIDMGQQNMVNNPVTMQQMPNGFVNQSQSNPAMQNSVNEPVMQQKENAFEIHDDNNN